MLFLLGNLNSDTVFVNLRIQIQVTRFECLYYKGEILHYNHKLNKTAGSNGVTK